MDSEIGNPWYRLNMQPEQIDYRTLRLACPFFTPLGYIVNYPSNDGFCQYEESNKCVFCNIRFKNNTGLNQHLGKKHFIGNRNSVCSICNKAFKHKYALKFHVRQVHEKTTRVKCSICNKTCYNKYVLHRHMKYHY